MIFAPNWRMRALCTALMKRKLLSLIVVLAKPFQGPDIEAAIPGVVSGTEGQREDG